MQSMLAREIVGVQGQGDGEAEEADGERQGGLVSTREEEVVGDRSTLSLCHSGIGSKSAPWESQ